MPIRSLMTMPEDDFVRALHEDQFHREYARHVAAYDALYPKRDPALIAFETGDHAPPEMREKSASTKSDKQRRRESEQAACEAWLSRACPSGDAESVHNQWLRSDDYADWLDANPEPAASEPVKRGGWVMHTPGHRQPVGDDVLVWVRTSEFVLGSLLRVPACTWRWNGEIIAYSTDETCPEWTGEAAQ